MVACDALLAVLGRVTKLGAAEQDCPAFLHRGFRLTPPTVNSIAGEVTGDLAGTQGEEGRSAEEADPAPLDGLLTTR